MRQSPQCVNFSVRPNRGIDASPLLVAASAGQNEVVSDASVKEDVPPHGDADGEAHEEEEEGDAPGGASGERVGEQVDLSKRRWGR